ncbi:hypothetical protein [Fulvivirga ligni]|uniref:hypothetical protein n=1 Tax=Fulvivirga ligni TaxID=2904246 RepID=UPI001F2925CA|nr:hypothetical protein [Fulvivirga ligni]UII23709.1 hypothetical protein LVD16_10780 [Fulvivirga ligni]
MKNQLYKYPLFILLLSTLFMACQPEEFELGEKVDKSELQFEIYQDTEDPNMVILNSLTPNVTPLWTTPMGRSTRVNDTVRLAFSGNYKFVYGVQSAGAYITSDTVEVNITTMNLSYVNDPLWEKLTGGVGESKTWVLDLDEEGVSKYFNGPMYFYGSDNGWLLGGGPFDSNATGCYGEDCWTWPADWAGNQWIADLGDYDEMTFSLIDGAKLTANHNMIPARGLESGTFFLDADAKTLSTSDVTALHTPNNDACVDDWYHAKVLSLTDDYMQLGFVRKESCDGVALLVFNYISKEYSENWVPEDQPEPEPTLPDGWLDDVSRITNSELTWKLSPETPFNWTSLDGTFLNNWSSPADYPAWSGFDANVPATYEDFELTFNSDDYTVEYVDPSGNVTNGTYTLDENGVYTFDGVQPSFDIGSAIDLNTTAENQWRILKIERDGSNVSGMWVGARDPEKPEYLAYHLILDGSGGSGEPEGTAVTFDNAKLAFGDLEGNGNLRLELFNEFGSTFTDPPLNPADIVFSNKIEITFTLSGISLTSGAAGSYNTSMYMADADWSPQYTGDGAGEVTVNGDGTYTVFVEPGATFDTAKVFVIDILNMATDIEDLGTVTATVDNITIY